MIFIKSTSFQNTRWLLLFYNSCLLYTLQLVALYSISQGFYRFRFLFSFLFFCFVWQMSVYLVSYAKRVLYSDQPTVFFGSEIPEHNDFEQFWNFKFHFEQFPRNTRFLSFDGPSNYFYLFMNHRHFRDRLLSCLKVTKMWFGPNIK